MSKGQSNLIEIIEFISNGQPFNAKATIKIGYGFKNVNVVISHRVSEILYADGRTAISHTNHVYLPDVDISVTDIENITSVDISSIQCYENEYVAEYNFHTDLEELTPLPWLILDNSEYTGNFAEPSALQSKLVWRTTATQY